MDSPQYMLGTNQPIQYSTLNSTVSYPDHDVADIFGQVYLSRIYAKDLTALEIASSGKISLSPFDEQTIDIYTTQYAYSNCPPSTAVVIDSLVDSMVLKTSCESASMMLDAASSNLILSSKHDIHLTCDNNIYMNAQNLIINVNNMTTSYAFAVADTGELQLQQHTFSSDGTKLARIVARFGVRSAVGATASNVMALL